MYIEIVFYTICSFAVSTLQFLHIIDTAQNCVFESVQCTEKVGVRVYCTVNVNLFIS